MKKVLLIEDDPVLRESTCELLELNNYRVVTASDGTKGVAQARKFTPDIILCDIMMPEMDGYGVLEALAKDPQTGHIPFVFLTAKTEKKEVRKGMDLGADDYLTKPFEEEDLLHAIESRLNKRELLAARQAENGNPPETIMTIHELKEFFYQEGDIHEFREEDHIYTRDHHANSVFLVGKGMVKTHKVDSYGKELITKVCREGDFFGYTSFTHASTYNENATAIKDSEVYSYSKEGLKEILEKNIHLTLELFDFVSEDLLDTKDKLLQMAYGSVRKKTASTILRFMNVKNPEERKGFRISRADLASVAGITPESFIRTMAEFKRDGLIAIEDRFIIILDASGLQKIS